MQIINLATVTHRFLLAIAIVAISFTATFAQGSAIPKLLTDKAKLKADIAQLTASNKLVTLTCAITPKADLKKYSDYLQAATAHPQVFNTIMVDYTILQIISEDNNKISICEETPFYKTSFNCNTLESSKAKLAVNTGVLTVEGKNFTLQKIGENSFAGSRSTIGGVEIVNCTIRRATLTIEGGFRFID